MTVLPAYFIQSSLQSFPPFFFSIKALHFTIKRDEKIILWVFLKKKLLINIDSPQEDLICAINSGIRAGPTP